MITIAVDAMGGDQAPTPEVEGALLASREWGIRVILVGRKETIEPELARLRGNSAAAVEIHHAEDFITMDDSAAKAVKQKKDSSIRVACRLVRDGAAQGVVSAGNTGAVMATAKIVFGMIPGVERPALAGVFPTLRGTNAVMVDVGANVDCSPKMLAQFAIMGEIYSRSVVHIDSPRVGILSIGEEEHKGNELTKNAMPLLKTLPLQFIGNVEGRDLYSGKADVVVCDGFIGNVALKVSEGLIEVIKHMLKDAISASTVRKIGYTLAQGAFNDFRRRVDYAEIGGAPLLGVKGVCIISHGRSNGKAIKNAIRVAKEFASGGVNQRIESELSRWTAIAVPAKTI